MHGPHEQRCWQNAGHPGRPYWTILHLGKRFPHLLHVTSRFVAFSCLWISIPISRFCSNSKDTRAHFRLSRACKKQDFLADGFGIVLCRASHISLPDDVTIETCSNCRLANRVIASHDPEPRRWLTSWVIPSNLWSFVFSLPCWFQIDSTGIQTTRCRRMTFDVLEPVV